MTINSARQVERQDRLAPGGVPRWIRCYDNGGTDTPGGSIDRYTVVYAGLKAKVYPYLAMSGQPYHPQGFCQHGEDAGCPVDNYYPHHRRRRIGWPPAIGRRHPTLGERIPFTALPHDCQRAVWQDYVAYWKLTIPAVWRA